MTTVGSGIAISAALGDYPIFTAQSIRYAFASAILFGGAKLTGKTIPVPKGSDWFWLFLLAASGQALYNVAIVKAVGEAEPAVVAVFVGSVPLLLVLAEAISTKTRPTMTMVLGGSLVVGGAVMVQGAGQATTTGIIWSLVALACEAAFTLTAVPVLRRVGPVAVSAHACWLAAVQLAIIAALADGADAIRDPSSGEVFAITYLAIVLTAIAFVLWYTAVERIGPATAGLFAGLVPIAAAVTGIISGLTTITIEVLGGVGLVGAGIAIGLMTGRPSPGPRPRPRPKNDTSAPGIPGALGIDTCKSELGLSG